MSIIKFTGGNPMELNFGEKIKQLRRSRDLTQEALADALGISAQSVSKWECAYGYPRSWD